MPKFDFGSGVLNNIKLPVVGRSYDINNQPNRYDAAGRAAEQAFEPDALEDTGPYKAIVF